MEDVIYSNKNFSIELNGKKTPYKICNVIK